MAKQPCLYGKLKHETISFATNVIDYFFYHSIFHKTTCNFGKGDMIKIVAVNTELQSKRESRGEKSRGGFSLSAQSREPGLVYKILPQLRQAVGILRVLFGPGCEIKGGGLTFKIWKQQELTVRVGAWRHVGD